MARELDRRMLLTVLAVGTAAAMTGCGVPTEPLTSSPAVGPVPRPQPAPPVPVNAARPAPAVNRPVQTGGPDSVVSPPTLTTDPPPQPGLPEVVTQLPYYALPGAIALTIDDGFNPECVSAYVEFAQASGTHLTFNPNGLYSHIWEPHADVLRPLIEAGQVQIGNHTYHHKDLRRLSDRKLVAEIERNDEWVQQTFGITTRPWLRPPFGFRSSRTDELAGELGYTKILMWNGSFGDAAVLTQKVLLEQASKWLRPRTIMLGHANHPAVTHVYPEILALIQSRGLTPQTLDEAFGTTRASGG